MALADSLRLPACLGARAQVLGGPSRGTPAPEEVCFAGAKGMKI